jgi:hypothetical protein
MTYICGVLTPNPKRIPSHSSLEILLEAVWLAIWRSSCPSPEAYAVLWTGDVIVTYDPLSRSLCEIWTRPTEHSRKANWMWYRETRKSRKFRDGFVFYAWVGKIIDTDFAVIAVRRVKRLRKSIQVHTSQDLYDQALQRRTPGTGTWLFENLIYHEWFNASNTTQSFRNIIMFHGGYCTYCLEMH